MSNVKIWSYQQSSDLGDDLGQKTEAIIFSLSSTGQSVIHATVHHFGAFYCKI